MRISEERKSKLQHKGSLKSRTDGKTVQFLYLKIWGGRMWGKTNEKGEAAYEANSCFVAPDISEKY